MMVEGRDVYEPSIHATPEPVHVEQPVINEVPPQQPIVYIRRSRAMNDVEIPAFEEPAVTHEEERQQPLYKIRMYHILSRPKGPNRPEGRPFLMIMRYILVKKFKWRVTPPLLKKP
jgi:hypothetical protein